ncbi:unnamed protein product [Strongylus vulgaris]|uniref:Peptidase C1A papain C-terminal domain-containing protein n=1 Tax=Strongylus vulgaris TaxID=40348 RepID=A0A3P7JHZ8_STRVU|nr:unnamed protein product [Strongylus vulgaris]
MFYFSLIKLKTNLSSVPRPPAMDPKYLEDSELKMTAVTETHYEGEIPESFDARERWPDCRSVKLIRDQANCGSCWAVSTASAMSDRLCIHSNGERQDLLSDSDILTCCVLCGSGCNGGSTLRAYAWLVKVGACTGGPYATQGVCKPYVFHPCGRRVDQPYYGDCKVKNMPTPKCRRECSAEYSKNYGDDKIFGIWN